MATEKGEDESMKKRKTGAQQEEELRIELSALKERVDKLDTEVGKLEADLTSTINAFLSATNKLAEMRQRYKEEKEEAEQKEEKMRGELKEERDKKKKRWYNTS